MPSADYLIITALPEEREGVVKYLSGLRLLSNDRVKTSNAYYEGHLKAPGSTRVIVTTIGHAGRVSAATAATHAINEWSPAVVLLVGVAGGLARKNVHRGDVLVAEQILDYEPQRVQEGRAAEIHPRIWQADAKLQRAARDRAVREWPGSIAVRRPDGRIPSCLHGTIASGDKFVADENFLAPIEKEHSQLLGVEMEGGGVAYACQESNQPIRFLMIRSVSDLADLKNKERNQVDSSERARWRTYACHSAGIFAIDVIRSYEQSFGRPSTVGTPTTSVGIRHTDACFLGLPPGRTTCCRCQDITNDAYSRLPKLSKLVRRLAMLCRRRAMSGTVAGLVLACAFTLRFLDMPPFSGIGAFSTLLGLSLALGAISAGYMMTVADGLALKTQIVEGSASEDDVENFLEFADSLAFLPDLVTKLLRRNR